MNAISNTRPIEDRGQERTFSWVETADKTLQLPDQRQETQRLPSVLQMRDLVLFSLLTVLSINTISSIEFAGPIILFYWLLVFLLFIVPRAVVVQWLAERYSHFDTIYHWTQHVKGHHMAFFSTFCIWWPGVLLAISASKTSLDLSQFFTQTSQGETPSLILRHGVVIVAVFIVATLVACIPMRYLRHILSVLVLPYLLVFFLLGGAGLWWLMSGHPSVFATPHLWSVGTHVTNTNDVVFSILAFSLLNINVPMFMRGELRVAKREESNKNSIFRFLLISGLLVTILMLSGTFGIIAIVPAKDAGTAAAVFEAIHMVFGDRMVKIVEITLLSGQMITTITTLVLYSRILFVVAQEKRLPHPLARINRYGVPTTSIIVQSIITGLLTLLFFVVTPYLLALIPRQVANVLHIDSELAPNIYLVVQVAASILLIISSSFLFFGALSLLKQQRRKQDVTRSRRVRIIGMSIVGTAVSLVCILLTFMHSWLPGRVPGLSWTILLASVIVSFILLGWLVSALPRAQAALEEQRRLHTQESVLRTQLEESFMQQKVLLEEVSLLYREHAQAAVTDTITGLPNHRAVMSTFDEVLDECRRTCSSCAVLFIDLDHFKHVNDTWGHRAGDAILHEVARRLRETLRVNDFVGRYGGEEFAILLRDTAIDEAGVLAERLLTAINVTPCLYTPEDGQDANTIAIPMTTSVGVALYHMHGTTREALITSADNAMYRAKRTGRNRVCIADVEVDMISSSSQQDRLTESSESLQTIQASQAVHALTAVASARDIETHDHANRMVVLASATAVFLECDDEEIELIRIAALLHDIGKVGIPDAILHKPGPLTSEEWSIMRSHPEIGRTILESTGGVLCSLAGVVAAHHERWDGVGYPLGLQGESIPLAARILSVVDSYDAMTSARVYRNAPYPVSEARAELQRCAGSQFDPRVVTAFLTVLDTYETCEHGTLIDEAQTSSVGV